MRWRSGETARRAGAWDWNRWRIGARASSPGQQQAPRDDQAADSTARVPNVSKWAPYYYFKHTELRLLLERG
jgi:hypothetical protein